MRGEGFAEGLRGFEEDDVVEQGEGLERGVGEVAAGDAGLAGRGVEGVVERKRGGAFGEGVEAAAVAVGAGAGGPFWGAVSRFGHAVGLRRAHAGAADFFREQPAGAQGGVAHEFGFEAEAGAAGEEAVVGVFGKLIGLGG